MNGNPRRTVKAVSERQETRSLTSRMSAIMPTAGWVTAGMVMAGLAGCPGTMPPDTMPPGTMPSAPTGAQLFSKITQTDPYQQWAQFPDRQGTLPSAPPHGPMTKVFINDEVASALTSFTGQLPDGSIIVKENVGTDPQITEATLTVMWKVAGFNPDDNDWFWANMSTDGNIKAEGKIGGCINCHGGARNNDFVFVHQF